MVSLWDRKTSRTHCDTGKLIKLEDLQVTPRAYSPVELSTSRVRVLVSGQQVSWCALNRARGFVFLAPMETLVPDLKKIVLGSADLIRRASSLKSPSWKFPEKLAVSLDVGRALEERDEKATPFVLELVIDRYAVQ